VCPGPLLRRNPHRHRARTALHLVVSQELLHPLLRIDGELHPLLCIEGNLHPLVFIEGDLLHLLLTTTSRNPVLSSQKLGELLPSLHLPQRFICVVIWMHFLQVESGDLFVHGLILEFVGRFRILVKNILLR
jgi:hypothetical protein